MNQRLVVSLYKSNFTIYFLIFNLLYQMAFYESVTYVRQIMVGVIRYKY